MPNSWDKIETVLNEFTQKHQTITETIAAIATPPGYGGVGIVRVSGPLVSHISQKILGRLPSPRYAHYSFFHDPSEEVIDQGIALYFQSPHSFTGEDVLELHAHGGPVVLDQIVATCVHHGARLAEPGEFSKQAFLNDKLDLAQLEAISDLIHAESRQAAKSALSSLQGVFSEKIKKLSEALVSARIQVEAGIDFSDEDIDLEESGRVAVICQKIQKDIEEIIKNAQQGVLLREGIQVVIAGKPNAGKSSLLNALTGEECAIVTELAGTTRDLLKQTILLDGLPLHIIDTAGLRESEDLVEKEGIRRARKAIASADLILYLVDLSQEHLSLNLLRDELKAFSDGSSRLVIVGNKKDLCHSPLLSFREGIDLCISVKTEEGISQLKELIKERVGYGYHEEGNFIARRRHLEALSEVKQYIQFGVESFQVHQASELLAEDLRQAHQVLGKITGRFTTEDLLGEIFSTFCVGK